MSLPVDPLAFQGPLMAPWGFLDQAHRARRGAQLLAMLPRPPVALTPHRVVHRQNKLCLRHYPAAPEAPRGRPVVVVPSMINKAWICDLEPDRSLVRALSAAGHPTFLVDWGEPGPEDAGQDGGEVLLDLLHRSVDRACREVGETQVTLLGYCQGGTLAAMYAALRPARVGGLITLAAPVDFARGGRFRDFVAHLDVAECFPADRLVGTELMAAAFRMLDPMGNIGRLLAIEAASHDPRALARVLIRERWLEENVPMPGAFAREFIRSAYQENRLLAGTWRVRGEMVDLRRITAPLLVLACKKDFIAPADACLPLARATGSDRVQEERLETGHIGVVVGSFGPKVFYPLLDRWLRALPAAGEAR